MPETVGGKPQYELEQMTHVARELENRGNRFHTGTRKEKRLSIPKGGKDRRERDNEEMEHEQSE